MVNIAVLYSPERRPDLVNCLMPQTVYNHVCEAKVTVDRQATSQGWPWPFAANNLLDAHSPAYPS